MEIPLVKRILLLAVLRQVNTLNVNEPEDFLLIYFPLGVTNNVCFDILKCIHKVKVLRQPGQKM